MNTRTSRVTITVFIWQGCLRYLRLNDLVIKAQNKLVKRHLLPIYCRQLVQPIYCEVTTLNPKSGALWKGCHKSKFLRASFTAVNGI